MNLIEGAIKYPVTTVVGMLFIVLFGAISFFRLPVQLTPTIENAAVTVTTAWPGAAPAEIERQVIQEQENQLKSLEGLDRMESASSSGIGSINMTFKVGIDADTALINVSNRLQQVPRYPPNVMKPVVRATTAQDQSMGWFSLCNLPEATDAPPIDQMRDFAEDTVAPEMERIPGVGGVLVLSGTKHEMHFIVDPEKLAARKVTIAQLIAAFERENSNISGGDFEEGKNIFVVRSVGEFTSPADIENIVVAMRDQRPVFARDVGRAELGFAKSSAYGYIRGERCLAINITKAPGANLLAVMDDLTKACERLDRTMLRPRGMTLTPFADNTVYMHRAIAVVKENVWEGGLLAVIVLLLFLRNWSSTVVVVVAMPVSMIGTFLLMELFGRSINLISLAGMAFAVGMVVDNAIVVLENIDRHRQMGKSSAIAALHGAKEVWGAVFASTLTTVAVFLPIVFLQEEVGQLFRDIALAISCAIVLSTLVAMTAIPSLSALLPGSTAPASDKGIRGLFGLVALAGYYNRQVARLTHWICTSMTRRVAAIVVLGVVPILASAYLVPKVEYLPNANSTYVYGNMVLPSNYNIQELDRIGSEFEGLARPLYEANDNDAEQMPGGGLDSYFYIAFNGRPLWAHPPVTHLAPTS